MPTWKMKGEYLKNCNCIQSCPCDTNGNPAPHKNCEGMVGMHIQEGNFAGVDLKGVKWVATLYWPGAIHQGNGDVEVFIDEKASQPQRDALLDPLRQGRGDALRDRGRGVPQFQGSALCADRLEV
jgi:hypothetical protein